MTWALSLNGPLFTPGVHVKLYREWVLQPDFRKGTMLPLERFKDIMRAPDAGYATVYAFSEEDAKQVIAAKSSAGLNRFAVWSDMLMIDLDDGDKQLHRAAVKLSELGLSYKVWTSGGKGFHIGIPLVEPMYGPHVPYTQRKWVEALEIGADLSLYQHGRIISLPGRVHPSTGKKKEFHHEVMNDGLKLKLTMLDPPAPVFTTAAVDVSEFENGLWRLVGLVQNEPSPGNRHTALWSVAKNFADSGIEYDTVLDLLTMVNSKWKNPKETMQVEKAVRQAFKR